MVSFKKNLIFQVLCKIKRINKHGTLYVETSWKDACHDKHKFHGRNFWLNGYTLYGHAAESSVETPFSVT